MEDELMRILIVDDNPVNTKILEKLLKDEFETFTVYSGEECLAAMPVFAPDLILLDIMMPGIDGYEVCRQIKEGPVGLFTQIILVSGRASTDERLRGYEAQADDYVTKPFDHTELLSKIRVQFRLRAMQREVWQANRRIRDYNSNLEKLITERTREVLDTQEMAVSALAELVETRDAETGAHVVRMRDYSQRIAEQLAESSPYADRVDSVFLTELRRASPLHDIGKVGVSDAILCKPGPLTEQEFAAMRQHVKIGAETLEHAAERASNAGFLTMAAEIARYHHERYDGNGYLAGLAGEDIPLSARIVSVADVYDALTSKRVYKPAFDFGEAVRIIVEESGKQFDPHVVDAFTHVCSEFPEIGALADANLARQKSEIANKSQVAEKEVGAFI